MNSSFMKKIILILAVLLAAGAGWYFLYWSKTPAYAAGEIQQAVKQKDLQLFKERVDMDRVYSYAIDDTVSYLAADGVPDHGLAAAILKMLKKQAVDELVRQTELRFQQETGRFLSRSTSIRPSRKACFLFSMPRDSTCTDSTSPKRSTVMPGS